MTAEGKKPCIKCGVLILPATFESTGGYCRPCEKASKMDFDDDLNKLFSATPFRRKKKPQVRDLSTPLNTYRVSLYSLGTYSPPEPVPATVEAALCSSNLDLLRSFIDSGHIIDSASMETAIEESSIEVIKYLTDIGVACDLSISIAVNRLANSTKGQYQDSFEILKYLIASKHEQIELAVAYRECARFNQFCAAKLILEVGLDPDTQIFYDYQKSRTLSEELEAYGWLEYRALLLNEGEDEENLLNLEDKHRKDRTAYLQRRKESEKDVFDSIAVLSGKAYEEKLKQFIKEIRSNKWDLYLPRKYNNETALVFAARRNISELVDVILEKSPDEEDVANALIEVIAFGNIDLIKKFHNVFPDLFSSDKYKNNFRGESPLEKACYFGNKEVIEYILKAGVSPREKTYTGQSLVHIAGGLQRNEIIELLREYAAKTPAKIKRGVAVKGKAKDWLNKPSNAIEMFYDLWAICSCIWMHENISDISLHLQKDEDCVVDIEKTPLPEEEGWILYKLKADNHCCIIPKFNDMSDACNKVSALAKQLSNNFHKEVVQLTIDDNSGTYLDILKNGENILHDEEDYLDAFKSKKISIIPFLIDGDGFQYQIVFRNIKKVDLDRVVFLRYVQC